MQAIVVTRDLPKAKTETKSVMAEELNDKLAQLERAHLRALEMKRKQMKNNLERAEAMIGEIKKVQKEIAQFGNNEEFDIEEAETRVAVLKKFRDGFLEISKKAGEHVKWEEETHPLDVEYLKRHGCLVWEEEDKKLGEERIKKVEEGLGIERGKPEFATFSDKFVVGLIVAYGAQ